MSLTTLPIKDPRFEPCIVFTIKTDYPCCCGDDNAFTEEMVEILKRWKKCIEDNKANLALAWKSSPKENWNRLVVMIAPRIMDSPEILSMMGPIKQSANRIKEIQLGSLQQKREVSPGRITDILDIEGDNDEACTISYQLDKGQPPRISYKGRSYGYLYF